VVEQAQMRRDFEMSLFNAEGERETKRRAWEEALAKRQMDHAAALSKEQLGAAMAAQAAKRAVWATGFAALGAIIQGAMAVWPYVH
jgi:hypothetical protein